MHDFLASALFRYVVFPIGSALLGILIKVITTNDKYTAFKKEDLAVGLQLMLSGCLMFVLVTTDRALQLVKLHGQLKDSLNVSPIDQNAILHLQDQILKLTNGMASAGLIIASMFLALLGVSTIVRKLGWESDTKLKTIPGITIPLVIGVLFLLVVMAGATQ